MGRDPHGPCLEGRWLCPTVGGWWGNRVVVWGGDVWGAAGARGCGGLGGGAGSVELEVWRGCIRGADGPGEWCPWGWRSQGIASVGLAVRGGWCRWG